MSAESILQLISSRGPQVPMQVAQAIGTDSIIASAHLSDLSSRGKVKISKIKVGSSPLYYLPGQEGRLREFVNNLHHREKKAYDLLSERKIIRDIEQEPAIRVALRNIKDFAVPLEVERGEIKEVFWKWFLLTSQDSQKLINDLLTGRDEKPAEAPPESVPPEKVVGEKKEVVEQEVVVEPAVEKKPLEVASEGAQEKLVAEEAAVVTHDAPAVSNPAVKTGATPKAKKQVEDADFAETILGFFSSSNISILSREVLKKTEVDYLLKIPSAVGDMEYYCKARKKKTINDADLASAFVQGQLRKLPVLFLTTGKLTKRAQEMMVADFKGIAVREL
ncbi:MAG: hypothetical protein O2779_05130 [Nanoarchaeota archaeon]|nr:hypothetical protein [Nanoarchaeota archaeon]